MNAQQSTDTPKKHLLLGCPLFCLILTLIPFAYLVFIVIKYSVDVPFMDQWLLIRLLDKSYEGTLSFQDLWAQTGGHRILFPRLIMIILARLTGWNIHYEMAVNILLGTGVFAAIVHQIRITTKSMGSHRTFWIIPVVSFIVFSLNQAENWLYGMQITYWLNVFAVVCGIVLMASPILTARRFLIALLLGIIASYSLALGLLYWPIGLLILHFTSERSARIRKPCISIWVVIALVTTALHCYSYKLHGQPSLWVVAERPIDFTKYVLNFLGAPLLTFGYRLQDIPVLDKVPFSGGAVFLIGFVGIFLFGYTGSVLVKSGHVNIPTIIPYISLSLYSVGSALLTAIGRASFGMDQAMSSRYVTISNLFWISTVVLLYLLYVVAGNELRQYSSKKKKFLRKYSIISISAIVLLVALSSSHRSISAKNRYEYLLSGRNELLQMIENSDYAPIRPLFPNEFVIRKRMNILKKYRLSLFRVDQPHLGPKVTNAKVEPCVVANDGTGSALITASVFSSEGDFGDSIKVAVDLSWRIFPSEKMYDDGSHGDVNARDGIFSYLATISEGTCDSPKMLVITATDESKNTGMDRVVLHIIDPRAVYADNSDAEFVCDDWIVCGGMAGACDAYNYDFARHIPGNGECTATWRLDIPQAGGYEVYSWWTAGYMNRATNAKFTIYHEQGLDTVEVNQMINGGRWNYLGTYYFAPGGSGHIVLTNDADHYVIADALKLIMKQDKG